MLCKDVEVGIFEADLVVDSKVIIEIKSVSKFSGNHHAHKPCTISQQQVYALPSYSTLAAARLTTAESSDKPKRKIRDHSVFN